MKESKQGLLVHNWAPQIDILSHTSTGAFLSHCGWNSVLESLRRGVPIIWWLLAAEQFYNSKLLEEELVRAWNWQGERCDSRRRRCGEDSQIGDGG
uniref:Uncharacterized protein n=1 Tax=Nelumbo nucifera TaxID=4432 RepID=A0A822YDE0_NELNU|nr:TPA_asm: hypothetical protein HUJ06_009441 [Nelumbo nucifera]